MKYLIILFAVMFLAAPASAEDKASVMSNTTSATRPEKIAGSLDDVVVTATRTERSDEKVPEAVTVVSQEEIRDTRMFGIKEALTGIAGIQSETKNGGYDSRLIIRGAGLKARYGVREIMILLDGVPITDPDGMSRLDFVDTQLVERIDVVKGPNSTMYGANAAGGVVNIITKTPFSESKDIKIAYGTENTQMYNLTYSNRIGENYFSISGSRRSTDSWRPWNEFRTNQASFKVGHLFEDGATFEGVVNYTNAQCQLPGGLTKAQFNKDIATPTTEVWRNSARNSEIVSTNIKYEKEVGNLKVKPMFFFQTWNHYHPVTGIINDGGANVFGADIQLDYKHTIVGMEGVLTGGLAGQIDNSDGSKYQYQGLVVDITGQHTTTNAKGKLAEIDNDSVSKWGVYLQESLKPVKNLIVDMGVRYDQVRFDLDDKVYSSWNYANPIGAYVKPANSAVVVNKTFDYVSPRIGTVYTVWDIFNLYGTVSTGFQTPQGSELSLNNDLKPMTVYNYEGGIKSRFPGGHSLDISCFYMTLKNEVVQSIETGGVSSYSNAGRTRKQGVEVTGSAQLYDGLSVGGTYTYSDFRYASFNEPVRVKGKLTLFDRSGNRLPYIPVHQYSLFALYKHPSGVRVKVDTTSWDRYFVDNANSERYKGYRFLTNLLVGYTYKKFDITCTIYNIFNQKYAMEVSKEAGGVAKYRPGSPISAMVQVGYKFQ